MANEGLGLHTATPAELQQRLEAERSGLPFLLYRDGEGAQRIVPLPASATLLSVGRAPGRDICLAWDPEVSRLHAEFHRVADQWVVADDGLSSNGTFVRSERVAGRRRLEDGDIVGVGSSRIVFRDPGRPAVAMTRLSDHQELGRNITEAQRRVLVALCRPFKDRASDAVPATNPQIAAELYLSVDAVKTHLRAIARAFGVEDLPQQEKRRRIVTLAFASDVISARDL